MMSALVKAVENIKVFHLNLMVVKVKDEFVYLPETRFSSVVHKAINAVGMISLSPPAVTR